MFPEKRAAAQKAERDFFALLRENNAGEGLAWKDFKRKISSDSRYDAVGSSSLREELFNTFLKVSTGDSASHHAASGSRSPGRKTEEDPEEAERQKKEKRERALRERAQKVKADLSKVGAQIERSRAGLNKEEDERDFRCA